MVKEFKQYDEKYKSYKGKFFLYESDLSYSLPEFVRDYEENGFLSNNQMTAYSHEAIRFAVYNAGESSEAWQRFRVSLKGFNTKKKMVRLKYRWKHFVNDINNNGFDEKDKSLERIRIINYLGALRRGGQLDSNNNIVR